MHGGMTHSQGEMEENPIANHPAVEYGRLKQLFDEDSSNESYSLPFDSPDDLMTHFVELEE